MSRGRKSSARGPLEQNPVPKVPADRCIWTEDDEAALIDYIAANRSKGGDGMNFDRVFWIAAATEMAKHASSGASKTANSCKSKWARVCHATISPLVRTSLICGD